MAYDYKIPKIEIRLISKDPEKQDRYTDITAAISDVTWSGDYQQVSRTLEFNVINPVNDKNAGKNVPIPEIGDHIWFYMDGETFFTGHVWQRDQTSTDQFTRILCYDWLIYMTKSQISKVYKNCTPEGIAEGFCDEYKLQKGSFARTRVKRDYVAMGQTYYDVIMAAYTYASKKTGKKYMPIQWKRKVSVIEKGSYILTTMLDSEYNLLGSTFSENLDEMVNKVIVYDQNANVVIKKGNRDWEMTYGLLQAAIQSSDGEDNETIAKNALHDMGREATVSALGNKETVTGRGIGVKDKHTGLIGVFHIDNDKHSFKDNTYTMELTLHLECLMDEKEMQETLDTQEETETDTE